MKPELQRIAIAEACGWTCCGIVPGLNPHGLPPWLKIGDYTTQQVMNHDVPIDTLPDYLNNLNAMHEAEKCFEGKVEFDVSDYMSHIAAIILTEAGLRTDGHCGSYRIVNATASQRAEAFLKTLGKWVDE